MLETPERVKYKAEWYQKDKKRILAQQKEYRERRKKETIRIKRKVWDEVTKYIRFLKEGKNIHSEEIKSVIEKMYELINESK